MKPGDVDLTSPDGILVFAVAVIALGFFLELGYCGIKLLKRAIRILCGRKKSENDENNSEDISDTIQGVSKTD